MNTATQTAYGKSIEIAKTLMESAQTKQTELEQLEQETGNAKKAFRTAYEYWVEMQPIMSTVDYWTMAALRADARYNASNQDELTFRLISTVLDYLEKKFTKSQQDTDA